MSMTRENQTAAKVAQAPGDAWYLLTPEEALNRLGSSASGLEPAQAASQLSRYGYNELATGAERTWLTVLASQFRSVLMLILLVAAGLSAFLGDLVEAAVIATIVLMSIVLGFVQEFRAEHALVALRRMAAPSAKVVRGGNKEKIAARDLVPGDVVLIAAGDLVPADGRLLEAVNLKVDEAALTGESVAVDKHAAVLAAREQSLGDQTNMLFMGTVATYGRARMLVTATGMASEFGRISGLIESVRQELTPLQVQINRVGRWLGVVALLVILLITLIGPLADQGLFEMFLFGIALAVAVVPEALPAVITISLALGVQKMASKNALIRYLPAVETLGSTSVICSDKTGTLTRNEMTVRRILSAGQTVSVSGSGYGMEGTFTVAGQAVSISGALRRVLQAGALSTDAVIKPGQGPVEIQGDPTEAALVVAAAKAGLHKAQLEAECQRIAEKPFDSVSKRMTTLHRCGTRQTAFVKGAPEVIVPACSRWLDDQGEKDLGKDGVARIMEAAHAMASDSLRVIALAERSDVTIEDCEHELVFLGLMGMSDPPRAEVKQAVATCKSAGIRSVIMTGDHRDTARAIATELGILGNGRVVTGKELAAMDDATLASAVTDISVYARVTPEHKLRVVEAWQKRGDIVAMTGDGINDAPALKRADVGIAMGLRGTDVSRAAAAMILTDDNFASIVNAVHEGRVIFANIRKYLMYLLSSNLGEIGLIAAAALAGLPLPLTAVQILYINLATDGLPALALSVDPPEEDLMKRAPRKRGEGIFSRSALLLVLIGGLWSAFVNFSLFSWALATGKDLGKAMTMTFVSLVLIQFFKAYSFRSVSHTTLRRPFSNKWLNRAVTWELVLLAVIVYVPVLHAPFGTFALAAADWLLVSVAALTIVPVLDIAKYFLNRWPAGSAR